MTHFKRKIKRTLYIDFTGILSIDPDSPEGRILDHTRRHRKDIDPYFDLVGNKRKYETPEEMAKIVDDYFRSCEGPTYNKYGVKILGDNGKPLIRIVKPPTISGLARALGLTRYSLLRYRDFAIQGNLPLEFAYIVSEARSRVEEYAEMRLYDMEGTRGANYVLEKGFNWRSAKDDQDMEIARRKFELQKEEHDEKMRLMKEGIDPDQNVQITVVRATK